MATSNDFSFPFSFLFFSCLFSFLLYFYDTHPASRSIMIITSFLPMTIILMIIQLSPESSVYKNHVRVQRCFLQRGSASGIDDAVSARHHAAIKMHNSL